MKLTVKEMAVFSMLGAVMYASKVIMEIAPNIHLLGRSEEHTSELQSPS